VTMILAGAAAIGLALGWGFSALGGAVLGRLAGFDLPFAPAAADAVPVVVILAMALVAAVAPALMAYRTRVSELLR